MSRTSASPVSSSPGLHPPATVAPRASATASADARDWIAETKDSISARLEGARAAQSQARVAIIIMAIISLMMLTMTYNAYLSYDSQWVRQEALEITGASTPEAVQKTYNLLRDEELKSWNAAQQVEIALLGVHVSVDDAPVLGTFSLAMVSLWLLLLMRRENYTIGFLLRDTDSGASGVDPSGTAAVHRSVQWLIFHTIASNSAFAAFDDSMARVDDLSGEGTPFSAPGQSGVRRAVHLFAFGFARRFFFVFPVVVSVLVAALNAWSYFRPDPFEAMRVVGWSERFLYQSTAAFFVCWIPLLYCCLKSIRYSLATERVLRQYGDKLRSALNAPAS